MSPIKNSKPRRKLQHQPTNIDQLSTLLEQASIASSHKSSHKKGTKEKHSLEEGKGESRSKSAGRLKSSRSSTRFEHEPKSKSTPTLPTSTREESHTSRSHHHCQPTNDVEAADLSLEKVAFRIGSIMYEMNNTGEWRTSMESSDLKEEAEELRSTNRKMFEENNLLRVKNELLLDMITKKTLRITRIQKDLERMRKVITASSERFEVDQ